jgi:exopolysaccharide biosynthesis protein
LIARWAFVRTLILLAVSVTAILAVKARPAAASADSLQWTAATSGIEFTQLPAVGTDEDRGKILVTRIDPARVLFRVYYHEGKRQAVQDWAAQLPGAALIVNANYFEPKGRPVGLVMVDNKILNQPTGRPNSGRFQVKGEVPHIGALSAADITALQSSKQYVEGFEGFPLLIVGGRPNLSAALYDAAARSRRTVIAQDRNERILIIVTASAEMTLSEMTIWLQNVNLGIVTALNLDGGSSSQIYLASRNAPLEFKHGAIAVPVVLAVYPR